MSPPDFNWADCNGVALLPVARATTARACPPDLAPAADAAILRARATIPKRNVGPGYTPIAILGTYVAPVAGKLLLNSPENSPPAMPATSASSMSNSTTTPDARSTSPPSAKRSRPSPSPSVRTAPSPPRPTPAYSR